MGAAVSMAPVPARDSTDSRERDTSSLVTEAVISWEPMSEMLLVMPVAALWVMDTRMTTAITPMIMPSIVRKERILWLTMACRDSFTIFLVIGRAPFPRPCRPGRKSLPLGLVRHLGVVGDEHDGVPRLPQALDDVHDLLAGGGVQVAGGLIRQDDGGLHGQHPGDGHPLLLAAGDLAGPVVHTVREAHLGQGGLHPLPALGGGKVVVEQGHLHIFEGGELRQQVELLEDEADLLAPDLTELVLGAVVHVLPVQQVVAAVGHVQAADDVHQGGLPAARGPQDGHELPGADVEAHVLEHVHRGVPQGIGFIDVL